MNGVLHPTSIVILSRFFIEMLFFFRALFFFNVRFNFEKDPYSRSWDMVCKFSLKIFIFCSSFHKLCKNSYNSCMRVLIWLKFGTCIGYVKANTSINYGVKMFNIQGVKITG